MAQRHWLDPLARRLLQAAGQLPPDPPRRDGARAAAIPAAPPADGAADHTAGGTAESATDSVAENAIEQELLALKLRHNPAFPLRSAEDVRRLAALGWRLDVNRATRADWLRLPGIHPAQVDLLLRLQAGGVQLSGPEDLQRLLELAPGSLQAWLPVLAFRWYGEPPGPSRATPTLDLNRANRQQLGELGLSAERCQRLLRERARHPFQDLADLQQRLQLPPAVVEGWIGKVRFGRGPTGPVLPPPLHRSS